jgi:hypothetical protein
MRFQHQKILRRRALDRKQQLTKLLKQVDENNKAILEGRHLPHPLLWEEKQRIAEGVGYHRELESDEIHFPPRKNYEEM